MSCLIRPATPDDHEAIWRIMEPIIRAGETYTLPRVANAGFMVSDKAGGKGVGQAMCEHALTTAKARGFSAMQFNFVVASNDRAVRLWQRMGFAEIGRARDAFQHPLLGLVDALVMHRKL
jgi:ribosomal protein S18 acetylase RimI-like enzyme